MTLVVLSPCAAVARAQGQITTLTTDAAKGAKVEMSASALNFLASSYAKQSYSDVALLEEIPRDKRVSRMGHYLTTKGETTSRITEEDLDDFSWAYLAHDFHFTSATVVTNVDAATIEKIQAGRVVVRFYMPVFRKKGDRLVLPTVAGTYTVSGFTTTGKAAWSGSGAAGAEDIEVSLLGSQQDEGCKIVVNSKPERAAVFFNGKGYHEATNTISVRDSGSWTVRLRKDGYEDWEAKRDMGSKEVWTIEATLVPRKP